MRYRRGTLFDAHIGKVYPRSFSAGISTGTVGKSYAQAFNGKTYLGLTGRTVPGSRALVGTVNGHMFALDKKDAAIMAAGAGAYLAGSYMLQRHRANALKKSRGQKGISSVRSGGKPLSAKQLAQRRAAAKAPRARHGRNVSSVRSGRRI